MPAACKKGEGTNLTMILKIISTDVLLEKAYWEQQKHLDVLRDYRFILFDRTLNAKTYVHLPRANVTYLKSK